MIINSTLTTHLGAGEGEELPELLPPPLALFPPMPGPPGIPGNTGIRMAPGGRPGRPSGRPKGIEFEVTVGTGDPVMKMHVVNAKHGKLSDV